MSEPAPWWAEGLRFHCTACGVCCTGPPGHVWVTPEEVARLAKAVGLGRRAFRRRYVRKVGRRLSLREREGGDCVMLEGKRCRAYEAKPARCSTFPFWPEVLESPEAWEEAAADCEGIGQGARYDREAIERLLAGDARPLLRRQAEGPGGDADPDGDAHGGDAGPPAVPASEEDVADAVWEAALADLEGLYAELEAELPSWGFTCAASGRCCDFEAYGHRLYVSTLEAVRFFRHAPSPRANDDERACPAWGADRLCHAREGRMLGCRTYFCGPYPHGVPETLHERYHARLKALHDRHGIPWRYRDITAWAVDLRPAPAAGAVDGNP